MPIIKNCLTCEKEFKTTPYMIKKGWGKYCSIKCRPYTGAFTGKKHSESSKNKISNAGKGKRLGKENPAWKGGKILVSQYYRVLVPTHPFSDKKGYIAEHRLVMEKHIGRYLTKEETIHHRGINHPMDSVENKTDNRIINLKLFKTKGEHIAFHNMNKL